MTLRSLVLLCLAAAPCACLGAKELSLDAPTGVTLSVDAANAGLLSWRSIDRDDLMGYSIWMRQGKEEYTRLSIPMMIGKELKKLNMTTKNSLLLKGAGKRELDIVVIAEYESGRSKPSASVLTKKAKREAPAEAPPGPAADPSAGSEQAASATAEAEPAKTPVPAIGGDEGEGPAQDMDARLRPQRSEMAAPGSFHSSVGASFLYELTEARGFNSLTELGYYIVGQPDYDRVTQRKWYVAYTRRSIRIPLAVQYGLLPQLELGADVDVSNEKVYGSKFDFGQDTFEAFQSYSTIETTALTNPGFKARLQPVLSVPLRFGLRFTVPYGARSRLKGWDEYLFGVSQVAGVDDATSRLQLTLEYGDKSAHSGIFYRALYMPAATETDKMALGSGSVNFGASRGALMEGSVGYNVPWVLGNKPGNIAMVVSISSQEPSKWTVNGIDITDAYNLDQAANFKAFSGINRTREDHLEFSVEYLQNVFATFDPKGQLKSAIDAQGKLGLALKPDGWLINIGGGFLY